MSVNEKNTPVPVTGISAEQLKDILEAVRKPVKSEEQIRAEEERIRDREALGATLKTAQENRIINQERCSHVRGNGSTTAIYLTNLNAMYCQRCTLMIKPDTHPEIFNRLYQISIAGEEM